MKIQLWRLPSGRLSCSLLAAVVVLAVFLTSGAPALADGGIAMSGSFYQQEFKIPQGSSISGPDIYVVVFNTSSDPLKVKMTTQSPPGVRLVLSKSEFALPASQQMQVLVTVEVGTDAAPGEYDISISAESQKEAKAGIQLAGAASQRAKLVVLGESGTVSVQATSPDRQPMVATVRLYRLVSGQQYEIAYSEKGTLEIKVAPGSFVAASFMGGIKLAEEKFDVATGENKKITLSGATVYFEGFDLVPNSLKDSGKLAFIQIVYTVKNVYQRVEKGEVILQVSHGADSPGELVLATLSPLETGRVGLNYNYIPPGGWADGSYDFKLQLNLDGKPYASSLVKHLTVSGGAVTTAGEGSPTPSSSPSPLQSLMNMNPFIIGGIAFGVVVVVILILIYIRMSQRY